MVTFLWEGAAFVLSLFVYFFFLHFFSVKRPRQSECFRFFCFTWTLLCSIARTDNFPEVPLKFSKPC